MSDDTHMCVCGQAIEMDIQQSLYNIVLAFRKTCAKKYVMSFTQGIKLCTCEWKFHMWLIQAQNRKNNTERLQTFMSYSYMSHFCHFNTANKNLYCVKFGVGNLMDFKVFVWLINSLI
jgi:hypothetical protein